MRKILVTGGNGFIGCHVVRRLIENGYSIRSFDIKEPTEEVKWWLKPVEKKISTSIGAIDNWSQLVEVVRDFKPNCIVHMATITNPVFLNNQPRLAMTVNLGGTFNVLETARIFGIERVIYFSSIGILPAKQYEPIDVKHPIFLATEGPGTNFYGASKAAEEAFCWAYKQSYGLDFITLRPSAVYGFGMNWPIFIKPMVENSLKGIKTRFDKGKDFPRDYTHVEDVAQLVQKAIEVSNEDVHDRVFYAATGMPLNTAGQIAEIIKGFIPGADIEIGEGLSEADLLEIRYRGVLDINNAKLQLGYSPKYSNIHDGVSEYINTYRRYLLEMGRID